MSGYAIGYASSLFRLLRLAHPLIAGSSRQTIINEQAHRFTRDDIKRLVVSAVEMSWLTANAQASLLKQFRSMSVWNEVA
jgi:hypothetical protein